MSTNDKDQVTSDGAVELDETELSEATGGVKFAQSALKEAGTKSFEAWPSKWKMTSFDGKGSDVTTEVVKDTTSKVYPKVE